MNAITDAMVRLLIGAPLHSDGKLTIVSLATEAGLRRNKLTHKHTGLKDLFYEAVSLSIMRTVLIEHGPGRVISVGWMHEYRAPW
ncbi:hypothetical protein [Streptomyces sp. TRM70350]|uniref:hypothetical protein n=1 Tax=Streptomyces sp. TRM70350 TaxID=2856165 RepID=UPI001C48136F|nr:hypothetical protein [Streptomyces sp. TRM70350]MBV7701075.1 hypothetical protein [Streptomyces sp. TRM70350]